MKVRCISSVHRPFVEMTQNHIWNGNLCLLVTTTRALTLLG